MNDKKYLDKLLTLNTILSNESWLLSRQAGFYDSTIEDQEHLFRSLRNRRMPGELPDEYYVLESEVLSEQKERKGVVDVDTIETIKNDSPIAIWQGDITRLNADAIVNAANSELLGCFIPEHNCIDNAIHSAAGVKLRDECNVLMREQAHFEENGKAKITKGYNLPAKHVIHTVGPIVTKIVTDENVDDLINCYKSVLKLADQNELESLAFCCISTGVFHFPNEQAADIAISTVKDYLKAHPNTNLKKIIFNVFTDKDREIYEEKLKE